MCVSDREPEIQLTREQYQILRHDIREDHVVKIMAFAGTVAAIAKLVCLKHHQGAFFL